MMNSNFEVIEKRRIDDLNSEGYILRHKKTKASVTILSNDDENKVFYIGFRTPPKDSTGVAHILEHSVLCGSRDFPVKDPFVELAKGSLNTFLNAMTYPDKTVYPVASCNDKDFHNLVHVYLDAVFNPNIYKTDKIFKQEGWHYELESLDGDITVNGVVYNEMKGVYSSPDDFVEEKVMNVLYPDTTYGLESGGDPKVIPELTYENFLDFHKKYYHPSNSYIYLYGNMDIDEYLTYLDEEYLSKYDYLEVDSAVSLQKSFDKPLKIEKEYPVLEEGEDEGTYLAYSLSMGTSLDKKMYAAMNILDYVLCSAPGAMIKKALYDARIGEDVYSVSDNGIYQPYFAIVAKNAKKEDEQKFIDIIESELKKAVENRLPKKSLLAAINHYEFKYRESDFGSYPRGLILGLQALDSWLYDKEKPFMHIEANDTYKFLKDSVDTGYFEGLISEYMLNNKHKAVMKVVPKINLNAKEDRKLSEKLASFKASLSKEELQKLIDDTKELKEYQSTPSPKEDLEKIPLLERKDLKKEALKYINKEYYVDNTLVLNHDIFTNKIGYLRLLFNMNDLPKDLYPYVGILKTVMGLTDTKNYTYQDLFDEINIHTGGLSVDTRIFIDYASFPKYNSFFVVRTKMLYKDIEKALSLCKEIIVNPDFSDDKRISELLGEAKVRTLSGMMSSGHSVAVGRATSYFNESSALDELINGVPAYKLLCSLTDDFDNNKDKIVRNLKRVMECIFRPENLLIDYTALKSEVKPLLDLVPDFKASLYTTPYDKDPISFDLKKENEGLYTSGQVQYVCRAGSFLNKGLKYTGALRALKVLMAYDYLWNNVRVLGGAYGCMNGYGRSGVGFFVSYRDPHLTNTIKVYEEASDYVRNIELDEREVTKFIIGALSDLDTPLTPSSKGLYCLGGYLTNITDEDNQKERDELLSVDEDTIHSLADYIDAVMEDNNLCVVGTADKIKESKDLFGKIEALC